MEGARPCFFVNGVDIGLGSDVLSMGGAVVGFSFSGLGAAVGGG